MVQRNLHHKHRLIVSIDDSCDMFILKNFRNRNEESKRFDPIDQDDPNKDPKPK